ncbi:TIGR01777 family oxidoreductase [Microlunatus speluncae]|uniref:TIGR01777 family oxidoreductase n=1 Tax=Microlunatus speluncae TaxID=2594267 RepID=UPI00126629CC|nr:TIGR01777 family oxidoreductase [Microlunatus speluncae]
MKYLLAGASGFLGTALRVRLAEQGDQVVRLVRSEPVAATEFRWHPAAGTIDERAFAGVDVVINLCGVGIADWPWTPARRRLLKSSRVDPGRTLTESLARLEDKPRLYLQASGISAYGTEVGDPAATEDHPPGTDFLSRLIIDWEAAAQPATQAGIRTVIIRTSPVLSRSGGLLGLAKIPWLLGLGAKLGDGRQRTPVISLTDYLRAIQWAVDNPDARGAYNLTIPTPASNTEFSDTLAELLRRPRLIAAPAPVLRRVLGEMAEQLLGDMNVRPGRLLAEGFEFRGDDIRSALRLALDD